MSYYPPYSGYPQHQYPPPNYSHHHHQYPYVCFISSLDLLPRSVIESYTDRSGHFPVQCNNQVTVATADIPRTLLLPTLTVTVTLLSPTDRPLHSMVIMYVLVLPHLGAKHRS